MSDGCTKRCFESVAALQRRDAQVLRDMLATDPKYCEAHGIKLSKLATRENLDYRAISAALMGDAVPAALDDLMFLSSRLGHGSNWDAVVAQAREDGRILPRNPKLTYADQAILLAIEDWPKHRLFLERANARARVHGHSSFVYYPPSLDRRMQFCSPTDERLVEARDFLIQHFVDCGLIVDAEKGRATEILPFDYEKEIWFLIRYPGKLRRQGGIGKDGEWASYAYNPEQYDVLAYNKVYGDLRMNTHRMTEHVKYRVAFGRLLFGDDVTNAFRDKVQVVTLAPLLGERSAELFNCKDIAGLCSITPVEIYYEKWGFPPRQFVEKMNDGSSVLSGAPYGTRVLPEEALTALRLVVAYKLNNGRAGRLTLHGIGNRVNYERDGDSVVLEDWLRKRKFVKSFVEVADAASKAA